MLVATPHPDDRDPSETLPAPVAEECPDSLDPVDGNWSENLHDAILEVRSLGEAVHGTYRVSSDPALPLSRIESIIEDVVQAIKDGRADADFKSRDEARQKAFNEHRKAEQINRSKLQVVVNV